ncbi:MAG TPA: GNAT family N-acetyltransferase [Bacillota bacterium]|nr:GNAT family N-acetyltransferase [Bacillota bacterium]
MSETRRLHLREITAETVRTICDLEVHDTQKEFVAPNAVSIAQAYFCKEAWFRAIYSGDTPVGFVMMYEDAAKSEYYLWRFMIDKNYQSRGFGKAAMQLIFDHVRPQENASELTLSCDPGGSGPEDFYRKLGFAPTGEYMGNEMVMTLSFNRL